MLEGLYVHGPQTRDCGHVGGPNVHDHKPETVGHVGGANVHGLNQRPWTCWRA